jgi:glycosyltransferase involved in cell wall biosynthesis
VCIHDANTFILPESYSAAFGRAYRTLLPVIGKTAKRVATVSQFSAEMLVKYGICDRSKIFVAPNGHEHALRWDPRRADHRVIASLRRPYVLLIGSQAKHKNISIVLEQAEYLDAAGIDIVVVGGIAAIFTSGKLDAGYSNIRSMGYVSDDDLAALYERALCLAFPSKTEGFGIPSLEGMVRGCPIISSNAASLVEVGGDAVLYVDPSDGEGWRNAILKLANNEALRQSMIVEGYKRAASFSWKRSAELYLEEMLRLSFPVRRL